MYLLLCVIALAVGPAPETALRCIHHPGLTVQEDDQTKTDHRRWILFGKVTDTEGNPIAGATVKMATGMGTLLGGGSTKTGLDGTYRLAFGEGIWSNSPFNMQVAWCFVYKSGYVYQSNSRNIDLSMSMSRMPVDANDVKQSAFSGLKPEDIIVKDQPHEFDIVMSRPAELLVYLTDSEGNTLQDSGLQLDDSNQTSEITSLEASVDPRPQIAAGVSTNRPWTLSVPIDGGRFRQSSSPMQPNAAAVAPILTSAIPLFGTMPPVPTSTGSISVVPCCSSGRARSIGLIVRSIQVSPQTMQSILFDIGSAFSSAGLDKQNLADRSPSAQATL